MKTAETKTKREKTVGNNEFVAHKWVVGKSARSGNMSTHDGVIYSYRTPIGSMYKLENRKNDNDRVFFICSETFSPTTSSKHMPELRRAIPSIGIVEIENNNMQANLLQINVMPQEAWRFTGLPAVREFYTGSICTRHIKADDNLAAQIEFTHTEYIHNVETAWNEIKSANKVNKLGKFGTWYKSFRQLQQLCKTFKLKAPKLPAKLDELQDMYNVYFESWRASDEKKHAAAYARKLAEEALNRAELESKVKALILDIGDDERFSDLIADIKNVEIGNQDFIYEVNDRRGQIERAERSRKYIEEIEPKHIQQFNDMKSKWINGSATNYDLSRASSPSDRPYGFPGFLDSDLLRLSPEDSEVVQTNRSAEVPLEHVRKALQFVHKLWETGKTYSHSGHSFNIGSFTLREVTSGMVVVGCHTFKRSEIERFALSLYLND